MQNASNRYPSDLTDSEWQLLHPLLPAAPKRGRPRERDLREILNGIFYLTRSGCAWRMLPKDFGPWPTVHDYYRRWRRQGIWEQLNHTLREQVRVTAGKTAAPSAAIIDSQTIKTGDQACASGYDAGKKIEGRKRHVVVDTLGLLLWVIVGPANVQDRDGARPLLQAVIQQLSYLCPAHSGSYDEYLFAWNSRTQEPTPFSDTYRLGRAERFPQASDRTDDMSSDGSEPMKVWPRNRVFRAGSRCCDE